MPRCPVFAGTWQIETNHSDATRDIPGIFAFDDKVTTMSNIVRDFYKNARQYAKIGGMTDGTQGVPLSSPAEDRPLYIFVAPEYYFKKTIGERCLAKTERDTFIQAMSAIAQANTNLLLIPGTVTWKKPADAKASTKAQQRLIDREAKIAGNTMKKVESKPLVDKQRMLIRGLPEAQYVAYNTAYLFYGTQTYKYHKMNDASEMDRGDLNTIFIPGSARGIYQIGGFTIGIEICADHDIGMLNQEVDIHIVTSASVGRKEANIKAKDGGLFIHASNGNAESFKVVRDPANGLQLNEPPSLMSRPFVGDQGNMNNEIARRMQGITQNVDARKKGVTELVRLAHGGKLTTWMAMLDTV